MMATAIARVQFAWTPQSSPWFELGGVELYWSQLLTLDGKYRVPYAG